MQVEYVSNNHPLSYDNELVNKFQYVYRKYRDIDIRLFLLCFYVCKVSYKMHAKLKAVLGNLQN